MALVITMALVAIVPAALHAQRGRGGQAGPPPTARTTAPVDLTGYWVSLVTEDWRYRMITPARGDFPSVPLNPAGVRIAGTWDPAKDEAAGERCKAYGAANVIRMPGRLHITWQDDDTLKVETEAGTQTRLLRFLGATAQTLLAQGAAVPALPADVTARSWQGASVAVWEYAGGGRGRAATGAPPPANLNAGNLKVVTTRTRPGYLQKNGVPYSENAVLTEYVSRTFEPNGDSWLVVTSIVEDPTYLTTRFLRSTHFKRLPDTNTTWEPEPCSAR
jgi:hypothetical protein